MIGDRRWRVWLTTTAEGDFRNIFRWTAQRFGHAQARIHSETLTRAIQALTDGPYVAGSRQRDEISKGLMTLHVARVGRRSRHFVPYRIAGASEPSTIDVLRLLYDSMDLVRHVGSAGDDSS